MPRYSSWNSKIHNNFANSVRVRKKGRKRKKLGKMVRSLARTGNAVIRPFVDSLLSYHSLHINFPPHQCLKLSANLLKLFYFPF
jgi:hypothetical protein